MIGNPLKIKDLISEMTQGNIRIPEIQRGYVWKRITTYFPRNYSMHVELKDRLRLPITIQKD
jgi:hypothetical protein